MIMQPQEAIELERLAVNEMFMRFQVKNKAHLTEMTLSVCKRCGQCPETNQNCGLIGSMIWHVFDVYFNAISGVN
jgi:hypothetical protein